MKVYVVLGLSGNSQEVDGATVMCVASSRERAEEARAKYPTVSDGLWSYEISEHEVDG